MCAEALPAVLIHTVALAGNPNVGKSTVFNELTGLHQHTGNWPGKTVESAHGQFVFEGRTYSLVDLPGTYSLFAHSAEEIIARDYLCFGKAEAAVVVCDATCLERNLNLVLQTLEITGSTVICVNLMDEAKKKQIQIDLQQLSKELGGVPVVGVSARSGGLSVLERALAGLAQRPAMRISYPQEIETALAEILPEVERHKTAYPARWLALRLLDGDKSFTESLQTYCPALLQDAVLQEKVCSARQTLRKNGLSEDGLRDEITAVLVRRAEQIYRNCVVRKNCAAAVRERKLDHLLTSRATGIPIMLALLAAVLWLTITGANYPSDLLANGLFALQDLMLRGLQNAGAPQWLTGPLVLGVYRTLAWVVSVMLPPMAIFFPCFTLLEDFGYLPRVAFNLDHNFQKAHACGKQALTMCMGFGCNAAGVTGCRIIDSPRERLIAILTNNFVPCNGRFPTLIAIISIFFVSGMTGIAQSSTAALLLFLIVVLGVLATFLMSRLLSATVLKGVPSSFTLELPPYRKPQVGRVLVRSLLDRTIFVLGRAVSVAAPAGLLLWLLANLRIGGSTVLALCAGALDPIGHFFGMDGVILLAFILGFPANEIVVPIILMGYLGMGQLTDMTSYSALQGLLVQNGWSGVTAVCVALFCLLHWPCATTVLTIHKESGSWKWTALAAALPTGCGLLLCALVANGARLLGLA
ncbi:MULTISPECIES: ferrous iron transport protein B [Caproicibacterium]|uniref:Ferrous iron transport protein B n=1 Tax=Caproicibacterium argilliputei TaxID=3030016 RepID=A0AA97DCM4_9FIRM|nr:ferrous iron transport protein B [Caproicibacterium argilliputei]WOC33419.1 ferrous iron transport protein B [Caproicibacterium argilliputei]